MKKRLWSFFLTLVLCLTLLPVAAFAEGEAATGSAAIQLGTDALSQNVNTATAPTVYFGQDHENNPAAWRVIGYDGNGVASSQGDMTMLAAGTMGVIPFADIILYNEYAPSNLKTAIDALAEKLTTEENAAVKKRTLTSGSYNGENTDCVAGGQVDNAVFWPLSTKEAIAVNNDLRALDPAHPNWVTSSWWLRSPGSETFYVAIVSSDGSVQYSGVSIRKKNNHLTVRPAFNLNLNSVLFASATVGGKPDGGLTPIPEYSGNEWKLTLLDSSRSFAVTEKTADAAPDDTVTLHYDGATTGISEYISAIIADSSGARYYGRVAQPTAESGTVEIKIPSDLAPGSYTLKVFSEQYNGGYNTDYASKFTDIALTVENQPDEQFTLTPGGRYYFDLSAMNIPGTANSNLPDSTLHYVPFTYAGTVNAYKLTSETATTEDSAQQNKYPHSLFIADYNVTFNVDWNQLNEKQMIFGTPYTSYGVNYTMRAPSAGSQSNNGTDDSSTRGIPKSNEWDAILDKANQDWKDNTSGYIKNWSGKYSFGQDNYANAYRAYRGYFSARFWGWSLASTRHPDLGFRPVLELPTDLAADSLKVVEVRLGGTKIPGETGNWINIIVKKGESFTAPSADGLPRPNDVSPDTPMWWTDGNGNYYKPGSTVPADVSMIYPLWGGFGLLLDRGDGAVEVTPDNYTDIFGDGSASFVLPKGETFDDLINYYQLNEAARHKIYSTGKYGENIFPNLKLKNAELTSVTLNRRYIEQVSPFFITLDGKNTIGSLSGVRGRSMTLSILGGGTLALNSISDFGIYAQNDVSVTIADALNVGRLYMFSGSLTVTDDTQAVTLGDTFDGYYPLNVRVFAGNSAQDAVEVTGWQLSPEMLALYQRFYAGETLTNDENSTLKKAIKDQWDVIRTKLSGKPYARFTQAWDVTYQPGTNGKGDGVTDVKFYGDALTLRDKLFTRSGYTQVGWATADGGEKIYDLSGVYTTDAALTLYPVWTRSSSGGSSGSSSPSYAVTVPDKTEHGTVTANRRYAEKGDTVTITVTPDSGYVLETITATDKNGNDLKLTDKGNGKYTFTMPGSKVEVKATFMEDNSVLNFFYDVPNDAYYYEAVKWAAEKGVTSGIGNSLFAPNQPCTRAQIVTFLWRAVGSPVVNYLMPFTDVDEGAYYAEAVRWAASTGIVTGLTETTFGTDSVCTRAQAAAMIYRCAQAQGKGFTGAWMFHLPFTDVPEWAYESVAWCYMNSVTMGVSETSFAPGNDCTRAQIVTFLWRAFGK